MIYLTIVSINITIMFLFAVGAIKIKKYLKMKGEATDNNLDKSTRKKLKNKLDDYLKLNHNNIKELLLLVMIDLNVIVTCAADLLLKDYVKGKFSENSFIFQIINQGITILIGMLLGSFLIDKLINKINIVPIEPKDSYEGYKKYEAVLLDLKNEISKAYVYMISLVVFGLLINKRFEQMALWLIILGGKYIWFGTYMLNKSNKKQQYKIKNDRFKCFGNKFNSTIIALSLILPALVTLCNNDYIYSIVWGIVIGMIISGIIYIAVSPYLLRGENKK